MLEFSVLMMNSGYVWWCNWVLRLVGLKCVSVKFVRNSVLIFMCSVISGVMLKLIMLIWMNRKEVFYRVVSMVSRKVFLGDIDWWGWGWDVRNFILCYCIVVL